MALRSLVLVGRWVAVRQPLDEAVNRIEDVSTLRLKVLPGLKQRPMKEANLAHGMLDARHLIRKHVLILSLSLDAFLVQVRSPEGLRLTGFNPGKVRVDEKVSLQTLYCGFAGPLLLDEYCSQPDIEPVYPGRSNSSQFAQFVIYLVRTSGRKLATRRDMARGCFFVRRVLKRLLVLVAG